jgi:hypothetical protein
MQGDRISRAKTTLPIIHCIDTSEGLLENNLAFP